MKKILIFLIALIVLSEVKGQVVVPPGYSGRNTRENILASAMNALNIPAGDSAQLKIGQWKRAGAVYVDTTGTSKGFYYYRDGFFFKVLEYEDTTTLLATLNDLTALPTGTSKLRTIPYTAFKNPVNPTLKEANTYVVSTYGSDSLGFFSGYPQYMIPNEVRQIVVPTTSEPYKAFPTIVRNPVTGTLVVFFMIGSGHANVTAASYMRSVDNGKTWSRPDTLAIRENGSNYYNGASISRKSDGRFYTLIENGIGNLLGLSARISDIKASTNDGVTFVDAGTLDGTSIFNYRMTTQTANILQPSFDTATFLIPVYGLDAIGTNFEAGVIKSNTSISSWTYYPLPQDSSVDKFNESAFYETKDSIFNLVRSEKAAAPFFYRVFWNNSANTWGTPTAITFNGTPPPFKTMPSPTVLPDGRIMLVIRTNAAIVKGAIWISEDNGLSYTYSGPLYSGNNPFMYASGLVVDNTVYYVYATETLTSPIKCWINLATFSANPSFIYYKDIVRSSIINAQNQPHGLGENWKGFTATDSAIRGPVKPTYIYTDSVGTKAGILFGGDIAVTNPNNSLIIGVNHTGHHSSTWSPANNKGSVSWEPAIGRIDSSIRIAGHVGTGIVDRLGYYWFAPANTTGITKFTRVNPFTGDTVQIPAQTAVEYFGSAVYQDSIYFMPQNSTTLKIININDLSVTNYTLPSSGWYGFNIVGGKGRTIKRGSGNEILVFDCKTRTHTIVTTPITGSFTTGPFDGRYQWYLPYSSDFFLKQDVSTEEVVMYGQYIKPLAGAAFRTQGIFTGTELWMSDILGNTIAYLNPITQERGILTLPGSGTYPGITWDGVSVYAIPRTGDSLYKIDPKSKRIKGFKLASDSATAQFYGGFMHNNKVVIYPSMGHTVNIFEPIEFAPDPSQVLWNNVSENFATIQALADSVETPTLDEVIVAGPSTDEFINFFDNAGIVFESTGTPAYLGGGGASNGIAISDNLTDYGYLNMSAITATRDYLFPDVAGTVALRATDSTASPINMIYQGVDGLFHKAAVPTGGGSSTFVGLTDGPGAFTGQALKVPRVNAGETALEYYTPAGSGTINAGNQYRIPYYSVVGTGAEISEAAAITAARALISDANGVPTHSTTTGTQLGYLDIAAGRTGTANIVYSTSPTFSTKATFTGATETASNPVIDFTQTWNNSGVAFTGLTGNITNTASDATSQIIDLKVGGTSMFKVRRDGLMILANDGIGIHKAAANTATFYVTGSTTPSMSLRANGPMLASTYAYQWSSSNSTTFTPDLFLYRDSIGTLAQRNGTNAQEFRIYNTDVAANDERATLGFIKNSNLFTIQTEALAAGTVRDIALKGGNVIVDNRITVSDITAVGLDVQSDPDTLISTVDGVFGKYVIPTVSALAQPDSLQSNQYVPTLANVTNVASTTAVPVNYTRNGSYVTVSGHASCTVTTGGGTFTTMSMTLPFASNFVNVSDCAAPASAQTSSAITAGYVSTNTSTDVAELNFYSGTGSHNIYFTFTYKIR